MTTVAQHLVEALANAGVRRIYGVVGDSLNSIVDAVHHSKKIQWIHAIPSATGCPALFEDFPGTVGLSDFPGPFIIGVCP